MNRPLSDDEMVERLKSADTVPEPSPLFWEHAARRVRAAVDAEAPRRSVWAGRLVWMGSGLAAAAMAALLVLPRSPVPTRLPAVAPGQTIAEIARVLGSSVGSVKANFFHALRSLRRLLGEEGPR